MTDAASRIADELRRRGLAAPGRLLADAHRPLGPLLTDLAAAITPLLRVGGGPRASVVGELLADPQGIDHLVEALDESDHGEADGRPG